MAYHRRSDTTLLLIALSKVARENFKLWNPFSSTYFNLQSQSLYSYSDKFSSDNDQIPLSETIIIPEIKKIVDLPNNDNSKNHFNQVESKPSFTPDNNLNNKTDPFILKAQIQDPINLKIDSPIQYFKNTQTENRLEQTETIKLTPSKVPSSRFARLTEYAGLALGISYGTLQEATKRTFNPSKIYDSSPLLSEANMNRLVEVMTRMRGATLKLGQMLSVQDNSMLPPELEKVLKRVQNSANYMPEYQLKKILVKEFGNNWADSFKQFDLIPFAAASIGQVHRAELIDGTKVAVKVQYPGVANSINSDLANLKALLMFSNFLPKGLYLDNAIEVAQKELAWECDYLREATSLKTFSKYLEKSNYFLIPRVVDSLSTQAILTTEFMPVFHLMQTDPNWSNFLYDPKQDKIALIDFGATKDFPLEFTDSYIEIIKAAKEKNVESCIRWSIKLGFLTGMETQSMINSHINSIFSVAEPFAYKGNYDFSKQNITQRVRSEIPTMISERLTPPPNDSYSLHRKLSGCFLLCAKLKAQVPCDEMFEKTYSKYWESRDVK